MRRYKEFFDLIRSKITSDSLTELSWVFTGQLLNVGLGFVILKLLAKLGTNDYGIYALVITISSLLVLIIYGPLIQGFMRFYYHYLELKLLKLYLGFISKIVFSIGAVFLFIAISITAASSLIDFGLPPLFFLFAGIFILVVRIGEFFNAFLNLIRKRKQNSLLQGGERVFYVLILLLLVTSGNLNLINVFVTFSIITFAFMIIKYFLAKKYVPIEKPETTQPVPELKKEIRLTVITYILPFLIWGTTGWLQINGEKWIIAGLLSTSDVGIYAVMMALVTGFVVVPSTVLAEFTTPIIFQNYSNLNDIPKVKTGYIYIKLNMLLVLLVTILSTIVTAFAADKIIILISSAEYSAYSELLPALCLGAGFYYAGQALTILALALNQPKRYIPPKIITGLFSVGLNFFLISLYGISGAAYAIIISGIFYLIYIIIINKKIISSLEPKL
jgi:O-antigen/teichoic acid export membrane protein